MEQRKALLAERQDRLLQRLKDISLRLEACQRAHGVPVEKKIEVVAKSVVRPNPVIPDAVRKVMKACEELKISSTFIEVASEYYNWTLEQRCSHLQAPSVHHLCKSILLENTACTKNDCSDPRNARFYMVLINYTSRLHSHKVFRFVRSLTNLPRKKFHFRLAEEDLSAQLSGYGHNAIPPLALAVPVPLIVDQHLLTLSPAVFFAGGGHVDWKLFASLPDFVQRTGCFVADVTHHEGEADNSEESEDE